MPFYVRPMREDDIHRCAKVEQEAFPTLFPPTSFRRELSNPLAVYLVACKTAPAVTEAQVQEQSEGGSGSARTGFLSRLQLFAPWSSRTRGALSDDSPIGFVGMWYMAGEGHIVSICVSSEYRSKGVGELLLLAGIEDASTRDAKMVTLEVRASNFVAQNLYKKYGFTERGVRKGYYSDDHEDAIIMTTEPIVSPSFRERFVELVRNHEAVWGQTKRSLI